MLKLFLQRTRFNLRNLFAKKIVVPTNFKSFNIHVYCDQLIRVITLKKKVEEAPVKQ